jgi:hypothetical protein
MRESVVPSRESGVVDRDVDHPAFRSIRARAGTTSKWDPTNPVRSIRALRGDDANDVVGRFADERSIRAAPRGRMAQAYVVVTRHAGCVSPGPFTFARALNPSPW